MSTDYTYVVSRLRAIEASMPDRSWFQRLVRTPLDGLLAAVRDTCRAFEPVERIHEFEDGIEAEMAETLDLVCGLVPDATVREFLRAPHDFDNLGHAWKASLLDRPASLTSCGFVDPMTMEEAVRGRHLQMLPGFLRSVAETLAEAGESLDAAGAGYAVEQEKWRWLVGAAPGNEARAAVRRRFDLANVRSIVRSHRDAFRRPRLEEGLIEGGWIEASRWRRFAAETEGEFYSFLETSDYRLLLGMGLGTDCPLWRVDPIILAATIELGRESTYRFFDILPVLHHLDLRERNCRLLRMVLAGKVNRVPEELVQENVDALWPS